MTDDLRVDRPNSSPGAAEVRSVGAPLTTPKSILTLSARPEDVPVPSGPLTDLRSERDPLTPELLAEIHPALRAWSEAWADMEGVDRLTESELRALWGDR
jgi:hypothetical protein